MANLEVILGKDNGNPSDTLSQAYPKINRNFTKVNAELTDHEDRLQDAESAVEDQGTRLTATESGLEEEIDDRTSGDAYLQTQINTLVINGDSSAAAAQAAIDADGHDYGNLKVRLDTEHTQVITQLADITVNVKTFGAKGDGVTDDSAAVQLAYDATPVGGELLFPASTYIASLVVTKSIKITFAIGSKLIAPEGITNPLEIRGLASETAYTLAGAAKRGDSQITLTASPADISAGDIIFFTDDTVRPSDNLPDINSEVHEVLSVAGTVITLKDFVRYPKSVSSRNITKISPVKNVEVLNCTVEGVSGRPNGGIHVEYAQNVSIFGFAMQGNRHPAVNFARCYKCLIDGFNVSDPDDVTPGNGYGVRSSTGSSAITILNGHAYGMRHAVDLDSSFDVLVSNVLAYNSPFTSFFVAHNSYGSDVTIRDCKSYGTKQNGFCIANQGLSDPYDYTFAGLSILNCEVYADELIALITGVMLEIPVIDALIDGFTMQYLDGSTKQSVQIVGIRCMPNQTDLSIRNASFSGLRDGIAYWAYANKLASELTIFDDRVIRSENVVIRNCTNAFRLTSAIAVLFRGVTVKNADNFAIMSYPAGTTKLRKITFDNVVVSDVTTFSNELFFQTDVTAGAIGGVKNIVNESSSRASYLALVGGYQLTSSDLLTNGDGETVSIGSAAAITLNSKPWNEGFIKGQRIQLVCKTANNITIPKHSIMRTLDGNNVVLNSSGKYACAFTWDGELWLQTS